MNTISLCILVVHPMLNKNKTTWRHLDNVLEYSLSITFNIIKIFIYFMRYVLIGTQYIVSFVSKVTMTFTSLLFYFFTFSSDILQLQTFAVLQAFLGRFLENYVVWWKNLNMVGYLKILIRYLIISYNVLRYFLWVSRMRYSWDRFINMGQFGISSG